MFRLDIYPAERDAAQATPVGISYSLLSPAPGCVNQMAPKLFYRQVFFFLA
jgi:hypothetical protein